MRRAEEFERLRPLLFAIAYRILGSVTEAEDAVQETWLRWGTSVTQPTSAKAFLAATVTRISIDVLRSARAQRETSLGPWLPEPLLSDPYEDPAHAAELRTPCRDLPAVLVIATDNAAHSLTAQSACQPDLLPSHPECSRQLEPGCRRQGHGPLLPRGDCLFPRCAHP